MGKSGLYILIFIISLLSIFIMLKRPEMHKQAMITDSEYSFIEEDFSPSSISVNNFEPERKINTVSKQPTSTQNSQSVTYIPKPQTKSQTKSQTKPVVKQNNQNKTKPDIKLVKQPQQNEHQVRDLPSNIVQERPTQTRTKVENTPRHELTEQEEIIAWNRWRSALQNKVMYDTQIAAPLGTVFKFSFTVDKYGNMSNVKVWSTTPCYSSMAVRVIKPVLMSYQHKAILNFPQGTKRTITNVNGGFVISRRTQYSSPSDYSDYERVRR